MNLRNLTLLTLIGLNCLVLAVVPMTSVAPTPEPGVTPVTSKPVEKLSKAEGKSTSFQMGTSKKSQEAVNQQVSMIEATPEPRPTVLYENGVAYPNLTYKPLLTPNDPSASQWWTTSTGLPTAWDRGTGSSGQLIAVIDSGFALTHEEFTGRWYVNPNETINGLDDDSNGFVDDTTGWDFINNDRSPLAGEANPNGGGTSHGTLVAGIIAATGNNGRGIAGINWGAKILPLQVISDDGYGDTLGVGQAVRYAADRGAAVINISLGTEFEDGYLRNAIQYALDRGSVVVAAAGNDGCDCIVYPARYPEVVAVGALESNGARASFSSYGSALDIMAPGSLMRTPSWAATNQTTHYEYASGTSLATPYVSGLLALGRSHQPNASWGQLLSAMLQRADHRNLTAVTPRANDIGFGNVKADGFISRVATPAVPLQQYSFTPLYTSDTLSSNRLQDCNAAHPSTALYQLTRNGTIRFTSSELERYRASVSGWAVTSRGYVCDGLPTDTPQSIRVINLLSEILNIQTKL